jgi:hypothetical protein
MFYLYSRWRWTASSSGRLISRTYWIGGRVDPRAGLVSPAKRGIFVPVGNKTPTESVYDWGTPVLNTVWWVINGQLLNFRGVSDIYFKSILILLQRVKHKVTIITTVLFLRTAVHGLYPWFLVYFPFRWYSKTQHLNTHTQLRNKYTKGWVPWTRIQINNTIFRDSCQ